MATVLLFLVSLFPSSIDEFGENRSMQQNPEIEIPQGKDDPKFPSKLVPRAAGLLSLLFSLQLSSAG